LQQNYRSKKNIIHVTTVVRAFQLTLDRAI